MDMANLLGSLYFAICFSICGLVSLFLCGLVVYGALRRGSMWRFSKWGIVNWLWAVLFFPFGLVFSFLAIVFWGGL